MDYPKKSYKIYFLWLLALAAAVAALSFDPQLIPQAGSGCVIGLLAFAGCDVLFFLVYLTRNLYWTGGVTYEEAKEATAQERRRYARNYLLIFLFMSILYAGYVFWFRRQYATDTITDALTAGGMFTAAHLAARSISLPGRCES